MFRIVDLGTQIRELELLNVVAPHLKEGGLFIGSGGRFPPFPPDNFYEPFKLVQSLRLSDFSDGFPFTQNTGLILQKT